jgi:protein SCO1/2
MRSYLCFCAALAAVAAVSCARSDERHFVLQGQILSIAANHKEATIKHEDIKGLMPAMTMPYRVQDAKLLDGLAPGDLIKARLVLVSNDAYLDQVLKTGHAPLEPPPAEAPAAASGFELLKPGDAVPDVTLLDQDGRKREFSSFKGRTVVLTFIYTRCPMPTFCPLMDRNFAAIQRKLKNDPSFGDARRNVHLVSVSFDPLTDTPPVLKKHATTLDADPKTWTFLTGDRDEVDRFAARFGVSVARSLSDARDITHNLRTAIIDPSGTLVKVYTGNEWTPDELLTDLKGSAGGFKASN